MGMSEGMGGIMPVYNLDGRNGCDGNFSNGNWMWGILLFALLGCGRGFGGFGNGFCGGFEGGGFGSVSALNGITNEFLFTNLNSSLGRLADSTASGFQGVNNGICDLGYSTLSNFKDLSSQVATCCCETNRNIDSVRYENAKNTCDIITNANMNTRDLIEAGNSNTQRIVDIITQNEIQTLRDNLNTANLQLSQQAQSANLINQLKPCPIPAYLSCSPYTSFPPFPTGFNNGFGGGFREGCCNGLV